MNGYRSNDSVPPHDHPTHIHLSARSSRGESSFLMRKHRRKAPLANGFVWHLTVAGTMDHLCDSGSNTCSSARSMSAVRKSS